ncbi:MAG: hypothetical protein J6C26_08840 [Clostridia bacterium]|nr:hypothetical protein [Clostridia bacterium]
MNNLFIGRNVRNLALRYILFCGLVFLCVPLISSSPAVLGPLFGVFYFGGLIYYFWFTMKVEGELDVNRVKIGQAPRFRWKGAVCALILAVPLIIINLIPHFFPDPVKEEYRGFFTGEATALAETDKFNTELKAASGKGGYVSSITFSEDRRILHIVYNTTLGLAVHCDGTADMTDAEQSQKGYYIEVTDKDGITTKVYYPLNEKDFSEEQAKAFEECKYAVDDIKTVIGVRPNWQNFLSGAKVVCMVCLSYFCSIFSPSNAVLTSVIYCLAMFVLIVAAQVGYDMGYNNVVLFRRNRPEKNSKAGDSVVIQRGRSGNSDQH